MGKLTFGNLIRTLLAAIGALALLAVITAAAIFAYRVYNPSNQPDQATSKDVAHIPNLASIPTDQRLKVLHSYRSVRSFTGDHIDGYCISLERIALDDDRKTVDSLERPFLDAVALPGLHAAPLAAAVTSPVGIRDIHARSRQRWMVCGSPAGRLLQAMQLHAHTLVGARLARARPGRLRHQ